MTAHVPMLAVLAVMLGAATFHDVRERRIPNSVVAGGMFAGVLLALLPGGIGLADSAAGIATGLLAYLPLHLTRGMGAGDVKLMAAVGAFVGWPGVLVAAIYALAAGGVLSLAGAYAITQRRVPFAAAIAAGTAAQLYFAQPA